MVSGLEIVAPFLGAATLEVVHWHQLRGDLHLPKYQRLLRSPAYWTITGLMIALGGLSSLLYFQDRLNAGELLVAGAAFPTLFKKLTAAFTDKQVVLGDEDDRVDGGSVLRDYFSVG